MPHRWLSIACTSVAFAQPALAEISIVPTPGADVTRTVGSVLVEYRRITSTPAAFAAEKVEICFIGCWTINPGTPLTQVLSKAKFKACVDGAAPCALDDDGDGAFDRIAEDSTARALKLKKPIAYRMGVSRTEASNDIVQTLMFLGATTTTISIGYREATALGMARPAFSETYTLPLAPTFPQTVAVRDTRITLLGISSLGLKYRLEE